MTETNANFAGEGDANDPLLNATVGNYKITRKIGEGGMGAVYLAEHPLIGKKVALKVLHSEFASNDDVVTRFFNEAKAVNDIQHPNIVDIIDYGVIPNPGNHDMVYFIMEHLNGHALEDVIAEQAPIEPERALHVCIQVADALAASHRNSIVHRDLKPDNIILVKHRTTDDFVKLLDFGIAKLTGDQPGSKKTRTGIVMGTPAYMSPEQCEGKGNIDARTDVYALGVVLYQMITGRVPFEGEGYGEILVKHLTQPPARPTTIRGVIPPHVEAVCMKALEKRPEARYQSMEDFMAALTDPVAFVEANGGLQGFYSADLGSPVLPHSTSPAPPQYVTPVPGQLTRANTQGGYQGADSVVVPPKKSKAPLLALGAVLIGGGVAAALAFGGGSASEPKTAAATSAPVEKTEEKEVAQIVPDAQVAEVKSENNTQTETDEKAEPAVKVVDVRATVTSSPGSAEVWIGDQFEGKTPTKVMLSSDELPVTLTLKKRGYEDTQLIWEFNPDQKRQRYSLRSELEKASRRVSTKGKSERSGSQGTSTTTTKSGKPKSSSGDGLMGFGEDSKPKKKKPKDKIGDGMAAPSF